MYYESITEEFHNLFFGMLKIFHMHKYIGFKYFLIFDKKERQCFTSGYYKIDNNNLTENPSSE